MNKEIPLTPHLEGGVILKSGKIKCDGWDCPNCGHEFDWNELHFNYCPWCGQRLNWHYLEEEFEEGEKK